MKIKLQITKKYINLFDRIRIYKSAMTLYFKLKLKGLNSRNKKLYDAYTNALKNMHYGALKNKDIQELTKFQLNKVNKDFTKRSQPITDAVIDNYKFKLGQLNATYILNKILKMAPNIKTIANIGARVDIISSYLSQKYSDKTFISIDLQPNLREINTLLSQSLNWKFMTGYALNIIDNGGFKADLVIFTSTSVLFNYEEFKLYLKTLSKVVKYLIFNEPWWPPYGFLNSFKIKLPEKIPANKSLMGGPYSNYLHPYISLLEENGFKVIYSAIRGYAVGKACQLEIIAKNKKV